MIEVSLFTVNDAAGVPPKSTPVAPVKPVPKIVTDVPPVSGPAPGVRDAATDGSAWYSKLSGPELPTGSITITGTAPGACAGVVTVMVVSFTTENAVPGVPSKVTPVAPRKPEPVIVT